MTDIAQFLTLSEEVGAALADGAPVVALETTILSHGMPYPQNVETARAVEAIVRSAGAVPATIAVIAGRICVGLDPDIVDRLGRAQNVMKLSRADLPFALSEGRDGATTVAATMLCAHRAGIRVFVTGGIGGVHRGAQLTMDVSADLYELARTPVAVVCSGAKALLDLPKTLEVLETLGVPVVGYRTDAFPAFWSRESGLRAPLRCDDPSSIARLMETMRALMITSGIVVANPIPSAAEIPVAQMDTYIDRAVTEAERAGVHGKALTPWLLERIRVLSDGASLRANIALVMDNARVASAVAVTLPRDRSSSPAR